MQEVKRSFFGRNKLTRIFVFEAICTAFLGFIVLSTSFTPPIQDRHVNPFHQIVIAVTVYALVCFCGPLTGGFFNPIVTISFILNKKREKGDLTLMSSYLGGQFAGALLGIALSRWIYGIESMVYEQTPDVLLVAKDAVGEMLACFLFVLMILKITNPETTFIYTDSWIYLFVPVIYFISRSLSRHLGAINPAFILCIQAEALLANPSIPGVSFLAVIVLAIGEIGGALLAILFFNKVYLKTVRRWK